MSSIIYVSQDGAGPSGVTTYGYHVLRAFPASRMLLLNVPDGAALGCPDDVRDRVVGVPLSSSHDVHAVATRLGELADSIDGRVVVLPNTGDTPWAATVAWTRTLAGERLGRVRVLGIVHSDVETQYAGAVAHALFAATWIGVSARCAGELAERLRDMKRVVHVLPYPVVGPSKTADANFDGPLRLLYAGRLEEPQKRVSRLAALFAALAKAGVAFTARVAGDGPARETLESLIGESDACERVTFEGALDERRLQTLYAGSDVLVLVSAYEGLPLALQEAMAAGVCPVVMETASGLEETIVPGRNGIVVPQGEVAAMARAIAELAEDRARLETLKRGARAHVRLRFSACEHFSRLSGILESCWTAPPPNPQSVARDETAAAVRRIVAHALETGTRSVTVFGAGMFGRKVVDACIASGLNVDAWVDSDPARQGLVYRGVRCAPPTTVPSRCDEVVLVASIEFAGPIAALLRSAADAAGLRVAVVTCGV